MGNEIRPSGFAEFIGQDKPKKVLEILCRSAKKKGTCVPHILLSGPPGIGKSKLARTVANEMGSNSRLLEVIAGNIQTVEEMVKYLTTQLRERDVLLIDEIHSLRSRGIEEILYPALQDGQIPVIRSGYDDMMKGLGLGKKQPTITQVKLPPFTCIGATTLSGLISDPLRSRFSQCLTLEPYSDDELTRIISNTGLAIGFQLNAELAMEVARRSRATARIAIGNIKWLAEYCGGMDMAPSKAVIQEAFALKEISPEGLNKNDMAYLACLVEAGEPLGLSTLSASIDESQETLAQTIEPFLLRKGYIRKGPRGRVATAKAIEMINKGQAA